MNRTRIILAIGFAVIFGLVASMYVYRQFAQVTPVVKAVETRQIVVSAMRIPLGTRLEAKHLQLIAWPAGDTPPGMFSRVEDCLNRALITSIVENEPILEGKLAPKEAGAGLAATIPEGMRALSVATNDVVAVAGFVLPATMVDVLVTGSVQGRSSAGSDTVTRTILENVRVLAAGQKIEEDKEGKPQTVAVITLLVTPEEANKLAMASTEGKIQLALRNTIDLKKAAPPAVLRTQLFAVGAPPRRAGKSVPAPAPFVVEVIVGTKRESKSF